MEARLKTSQKWVSFPPDICQVIRQALDEQFAERKKNGRFVVQGWFYSGEMILRTGFLEDGRLRQHNFEASIDFKPDKEKAIDRIQHLMESCFSFMNSYFENPEAELPYDWRIFDLDDDPVYLRYSTVNTELESEADRLLGEAEDSLVNQTEDAEIDELIRHLGLETPQKLH